MKHNYLQLKRNAFLFLVASALFGEVSAQNDSLKSARTAGTLSVNGTVTYDGSGAGTGGDYGTFFGYYAGNANSGTLNSFFGSSTGKLNTTGFRNVFIGSAAGRFNTTGNNLVFVGTSAGYENTTGTFNTFIGGSAGNNNTSGTSNTYLGNTAGFYNTTGQFNTFIGFGSGGNNITGNANVFLGYKAGLDELGSNKLYIANSETSTPLIYGEFDNKKLVLGGKVGISTSVFPTTVGGADISSYQLFVKGGILAEEVRIRTGWADYVFTPQYSLRALGDVENFIKQNGHLPNVPSAKKVEEEGVSLGEIAKIQQEKIEELTLYIIQQNKRLEKQERELSEIKNLIQGLK